MYKKVDFQETSRASTLLLKGDGKDIMSKLSGGFTAIEPSV
jgi:hypothetical protein